MSEERRNPKQTNEEIEIERACDLERYMFLKEDNEEPIEPKDNDNEDHTSDSTSQGRVHTDDLSYTSLSLSRYIHTFINQQTHLHQTPILSKCAHAIHLYVSNFVYRRASLLRLY